MKPPRPRPTRHSLHTESAWQCGNINFQFHVADKNQLDRWQKIYPRGEALAIPRILCNLCNSTFACRCVNVAKITIRCSWRIRYYNPFSHNVIIYNSMLHVMLSRSLFDQDVYAHNTRPDAARCCSENMTRDDENENIAITPHSIRKASPLLGGNFNDMK